MPATTLTKGLQKLIHSHYPLYGVANFYKNGEYLFKKGAPVFGVMYIYSGIIELIYKNEEDFLINSFLPSDKILCEDLSLTCYPFDARAKIDSLIYFFDKYFLEHEFNISMGEIS